VHENYDQLIKLYLNYVIIEAVLHQQYTLKKKAN